MTALDNSLESMIPAAAWHLWGQMGNDGQPDRIPSTDDLLAFANRLLPGMATIDKLRQLNDDWVKERDRHLTSGGGYPPYPLLDLVQAYLSEPRYSIAANLRPDRIFPASAGMVSENHPRAGRLLGLYHLACHSDGQLVLPNFGPDSNIEGPALPLNLYRLGNKNPLGKGGRGAPLALRLFIESILAEPYDTRAAGLPVAVTCTLRELLERLYPGKRRRGASEYLPALEDAAKVLDDTRIPWLDPFTGKSGERRVVYVSGFPKGLDDEVRLVVDLPPGSGQGPIVSPRLHEWGTRSAPGYFALLNLAYTWWDPGNTSHPGKSEHRKWPQVVDDPERYPLLTRSRMTAITHPLSTQKQQRNLVARSQATLQQLANAGELRLVARRALPPKCPRCNSRVLAGLPCSSAKCRAKKRAE